MTSLEAVQAAYPGWTIRRDVGPDWTCWTAQQIQVITAPTLDELAAKLGEIDGQQPATRASPAPAS